MVPTKTRLDSSIQTFKHYFFMIGSSQAGGGACLICVRLWVAARVQAADGDAALTATANGETVHAPAALVLLGDAVRKWKTRAPFGCGCLCSTFA